MMDYTKDEIIEKIEAGSKWLALIFAAGAALTLIHSVCTAVELVVSFLEKTDFRFRDTLAYGSRYFLEMMILAVLLLIAALMFRRIEKSGTFFDAKNVRSVQQIGWICVTRSLISNLAASLIAGYPYGGLQKVFPPLVVAEGLLLLVAAQILKYGALLQLESDETL